MKLINFIILILMTTQVQAHSIKHICGSEFDATFAQMILESPVREDDPQDARMRAQAQLQLDARKYFDKVLVLHARRHQEVLTSPQLERLDLEIDALNAQITATCFRIEELNI